MKTSQKIYLPFKRAFGIIGALIGIVVCFVLLWIWVIPIGLVFAAIYYFVIDWSIKKFDLKTPGREDSNIEVKIDAIKEDASELIVSGLGGKDNIVSVNKVGSRISLELKNYDIINETELKN